MDYKYYVDEVREGYFIPSMIKRSWASQLDVLQVVRDICEKHKIRWFADCGTLIGAIRHHGFIPWDDDLDICMFRDDFDRFNEVVKKELPKGYKVLNLETESEYSNFLTRITGSESIELSQEYLEKHHGFPYIAGIDIFPLDYLIPDDTLEEERREKIQKLIQISNKVDENPKISKHYIYNEIETNCNIVIDRKLPLNRAILRGIESLCKLYDGRKDSTHVTLMMYWVKQKSHKYPIECFEHIVEVPYETITIPVPAAYSKVLTVEYGNWEIVNRIGGEHEYPFYKSQEAIYEAHMNGRLPYKYYITEEELLEHVKGQFHQKECHSDYINEIFQVMKKSMDLLCRVIQMKEYQTAIEMMEQLQSLAIQAGTSIESIYGEGHSIVTYLEEYCEIIYQYSQVVAEINNEMEMEYHRVLLDILNHIQLSYAENKKKIVAFFPFHPMHWNTMNGLYEEYLTQTDTIVLVIPIPYYEKKIDGTLGIEHFDLESYPSHLNVIDYRNFDFDHINIEEAIIQNPHDEYNISYNVHPFFYSKNLKKYSNSVTYIPYFEMDELDDRDSKSMENAPYYVVTPGVIYSDRILLPSANMKHKYADILMRLSDKVTREYWENKIIVFNKATNRIEEEVSMEHPKCFIYYSCISDFIEHGQKMLLKLKETMNLFYNSNVKIIWITELGLMDNIKLILPELSEEYVKVVDEFSEYSNGEYYDGSEDNRLKSYIQQCNAYYGPGGYIMNLCHRKGVPVLLQRV